MCGGVGGSEVQSTDRDIISEKYFNKNQNTQIYMCKALSPILSTLLEKNVKRERTQRDSGGVEKWQGKG